MVAHYITHITALVIVSVSPVCPVSSCHRSDNLLIRPLACQSVFCLGCSQPVVGPTLPLAPSVFDSQRLQDHGRYPYPYTPAHVLFESLGPWLPKDTAGCSLRCIAGAWRTGGPALCLPHRSQRHGAGDARLLMRSSFLFFFESSRIHTCIFLISTQIFSPSIDHWLLSFPCITPYNDCTPLIEYMPWSFVDINSN